MALIQLRENREAFFSPETGFDVSYPGNYFKLIKLLSLTMPCVAGPYNNINFTLKIFKSSVRLSPLLSSKRICTEWNQR